MTHNYALPLFLILYTVAMLLAGTDDYELAKAQEQQRAHYETDTTGVAGHAGRGLIQTESVSTW
jgi:hypothetical protein